ncbi:hypothetical protein PP707_03245 [Acetobacter pasteurianus]|nr:hypothetical protein [Acetobacter pasteurianus]
MLRIAYSLRSRITLASSTIRHQGQRLCRFHKSARLLKDEKSKELLKNLGVSLQKGNINETEKGQDEKESKEEEGSGKGNGKEEREKGEKGENLEQNRSNANMESDKNIDAKEELGKSSELGTKTKRYNNLNSGNNNGYSVVDNNNNNNNNNNNKINNNNNNHSNSKKTNTNRRNNNDSLLLDNNSSALENFNQQRQKELYDSVSSMSRRDYLLQLALDGDASFGSFENPKRIDSRKILRLIPDELDLTDPKDMERVDEVYSKLAKLDSNQEMHQKYLKQIIIDYDNYFIELDQTIRGIQSKFKQLRRGETDRFNAGSWVYELVNDRMKYPYNVVGFDRSFTGMPLRSDFLQKPVWPREFIQDLPRYGGHKIQLKKADFNLPEHDGSINVNPASVKPLQSLYDYENNHNNRSRLNDGLYHTTTNNNNNSLNKVQKATHEYFSNVWGLPKHYIPVKSTENYQRLNLNNHQITNRLVQEIRIMKKRLTDEIKATMETSNVVLLSANKNYYKDHIKSNQYILCEIKDEQVGSFYIWKSFSILPPYIFLPLSKRRERNLTKHLHKLFLLNLKDEVEILFNIKYDHTRDVKKYMKSLVKEIGHNILFRLWRYFKINKRTSRSSLSLSSAFLSASSFQLPLVKQKMKSKDAILYKPFKDSCFKRIYWVKKLDVRGNKSPQKSQKLGKCANRIDFAILDGNLIE